MEYTSLRRMQQRKHILTAGVFFLLLAGLGGAEAYVLRDSLRGALIGPHIDTTDTADTAAKAPMLNVDGVARNDGKPVEDLLSQHAQIDARPSTSPVFLTVLLPDEDVTVRDLFVGEQFAGTLAWVESSEAKDEFLSLKEALMPAFSPQLSGLIDTTVRTPGSPTLNVLSFKDPALNPNQLEFARSRNRLFELHATPGMETPLAALLEDLASN